MVKPVPEKPTVSHLTMAKHVLRYLKGTIDYCLIFKKFESLGLVGFCDADWGSTADRRSITGHGFRLSLRVFLYHGRVRSSNQLLYQHVKLSICP